MSDGLCKLKNELSPVRVESRRCELLPEDSPAGEGNDSWLEDRLAGEATDSLPSGEVPEPVR